MPSRGGSKGGHADRSSLFTLTMLTVLALPINLVSGLFGTRRP
jgi:hypothetical protein